MAGLEENGFEVFRPKPDGELDPAGETGWYLERARIEAGYSLDDVSAHTGIHAAHLEAIESGDLTKLPSRGETLRMVGLLAQALGYDPQPLVLHYAQFLPRPVKRARRSLKFPPLPLSSAKIIDFQWAQKLRPLASGSGGLIASCVGAVLLFSGATYMMWPSGATRSGAGEKIAAVETTGQPTEVASISKIDEQPMPDAASPAAKAGNNEADKAANSLSGLTELIEKKVASLPAATESQPIAIAPDTPATVTTVGKPETGAKGKVYGDDKDARLVLTAKDDVWVRIEDKHGNVIMSRTLLAGDSYRVPNRDGLVVIARDGGLIQYRIDGKAMGSLGDTGEILVGRSIDIAKLLDKSSG